MSMVRYDFLRFPSIEILVGFYEVLPLRAEIRLFISFSRVHTVRSVSIPSLSKVTSDRLVYLSVCGFGLLSVE
jgi:hypothetical protein